jgi:hypothetical protein
MQDEQANNDKQSVDTGQRFESSSQYYVGQFLHGNKVIDKSVGGTIFCCFSSVRQANIWYPFNKC